MNSIMSLLQSETYSLMRGASDVNLYETSAHNLTLSYKVKLLFLDETFLIYIFFTPSEAQDCTLSVCPFGQMSSRG